jgi:biotin transport system ATP-binding protein
MIETRDLTHRYGRQRRAGDDPLALDSVSLSIADGSFVLLAGPNGAGKTTLVRTFNGLLDPDSGTVLVNESPVAEDPVAARAAVGMVFQTPRDCFVAPTVGADVAFGPENLGLPRDEIDRRVRSALEAVRMADRRSARIDRLSGGEQARVAIAGALAMEPDHLVLDEPLSGLDAPAREALVGRLLALHASGTGIVAVTHDLRDLFDPADRVVVLREGRVALDRPPAEVVDRLPALGVRPPC